MPSEQDPLLDAIPWPSLRVKYMMVNCIRAIHSTTLDAELLQSTRLRRAVLKRAFEGRLG